MGKGTNIIGVKKIIIFFDFIIVHCLASLEPQGLSLPIPTKSHLVHNLASPMLPQKTSVYNNKQNKILTINTNYLSF